eukprot:CAMPEP_0184294010 /NCGR_PEP_ID=MMETSP1049-20130417/5300_1 /TAXON_ID=77928 /ORGANISM="Proteomonas sulcata, Strain CCMP704" /LENGTH=75 /DNA_ID=CAMNT_0026602153 /DNA_START=283 /DNA_END=510 /DNA_ORIENTATION=+
MASPPSYSSIPSKSWRPEGFSSPWLPSDRTVPESLSKASRKWPMKIGRDATPTGNPLNRYCGALKGYKIGTLSSS